MGKKSLVYGMIMFLLFGLTACGKNKELTGGDDTLPETEETADTSEAQAEEIEYAYDIPTLLSDLKINGVEIGWPCKTGDLQKVFDLCTPFYFAQGVIGYSLEIDGESAGLIYVKENQENETEQEVIVLNLDYFEYYDVTSFAFSGVTEKSKRSEIIDLLGNPSKSTERYLLYANQALDETDMFAYDEIKITYNADKDGTPLQSVTFINSKAMPDGN